MTRPITPPLRRTAWRNLIAQAIKTARDRNLNGHAAALQGFRSHDLRHQAITELAEAGAQDSVLQSIAGHMSRRMMAHYSHTRMAAKRSAVEQLGIGLTNPAPPDMQLEKPKPN